MPNRDRPDDGGAPVEAEPEADKIINLTILDADRSPYHFTSFAHLQPGKGAKTKLEHNKQALRIIHQLKESNRPPTATERDKLARYVGNGTIAGAIDREYLDLTLDPQASLETDNAFQTSPEIIKTFWNVLERLGFTHGRILDPSANIGNITGLQSPEQRARSEWALVEINPDAAAIAEHLHPDAIAHYCRSFESTPLPKNSFDLVVSKESM